MEILYMLIVAVLAFSHSDAQQGGAMPKCLADAMKNPAFVECSKGFAEFMKNAMGGMGGGGGQPPANGGDPAAAGQEIMKLICSKEGRAAMGCMLPYMQQCPELMQQSGGMDLSAFMKEGGLDATCALFDGPCVKVMACIQQQAPDPEPEGDHMAMGVSANPFSAFIMQTMQSCGPMKAQLTCLMKFEKECGDKVRELEEQVKQALDASLADSNTAIAGYDQLKKFMMEECPNLEAMDQRSKSCVMEKLSSNGFTKCYENATKAYTNDQVDKCSMFDLQSSCLNANVAPKCGKAQVAFMQRNMNLIIKKVPESCTITDTSAANKNVQLTTATLVMVAVSAFLAF